MALFTSSRRPAGDGADAGVGDAAPEPVEALAGMLATLRIPGPARVAYPPVAGAPDLPSAGPHDANDNDAHDDRQAQGKREACSVRYSISSGIEGRIQSKS